MTRLFYSNDSFLLSYYSKSFSMLFVFHSVKNFHTVTSLYAGKNTVGSLRASGLIRSLWLSIKGQRRLWSLWNPWANFNGTCNQIMLQRVFSESKIKIIIPRDWVNFINAVNRFVRNIRKKLFSSWNFFNMWCYKFLMVQKYNASSTVKLHYSTDHLLEKLLKFYF